MAQELNQAGVDHARKLITDRKINIDAPWEEGLDTDTGNRILGDPPDWAKFHSWHLGTDTDQNTETKAYSSFPFSKDGENVYRSGLIAIRQRAGTGTPIFTAAGELLEEMDKLSEAKTKMKEGMILAGLLNKTIDDQATEERPRAEIISAMAQAAGIEPGTVDQILAGTIDCPPVAERLQGFASVLDISLADLVKAAEEDGCGDKSMSEAHLSGEESLEDFQRKMSAEIRVKYGERAWVREIFAEHVIFQLGSETMKSSYSQDAAGKITLFGKLIPVTEEFVEEHPAEQAPEPSDLPAEMTEGKQVFVSSVNDLTISESGDKSGKVWEVVLLQSGTSANRNHYPVSALKKSVGLFEGVRALARSDEDHIKDRQHHVKDIVGWFENVRLSGKALVADFYISEAADWLRILIKDAWDKGQKSIIGFSLVAEGIGKLKKVKGQQVRYIEAIEKVNSVDVVVNPAAGGKVLSMKESINTEGNGMTLEEKMEALKKKGVSVPKGSTEKEVDLLIMEAISAKSPEKAPEVPGKEPDKSEAVLVQEAARKELVEQQKITCSMMLTRKLAASKLPGPTKKLVEGKYKDTIFAEPDLDTELGNYVAMFADMSKSGKVVGLGEADVEMGKGEAEKKVLALEGFFAKKDIDGVKHFRSFREAYASITGDVNITGQMREAKNILRMTEALNTSSWAQILEDVMHKRMMKEYTMPGLQDWRKIVSDVNSSPNYLPQHRTRMGGYGVLPDVTEEATYLPLTSPGDEKISYSVTKRGGLETITREMIINDDIGAIRRIPVKLGRSAAITLYRFVFDMIKDNVTLDYDSIALFHADHGNLGSTALSGAALQTARIAMNVQAEKDAAVNIIGLEPKYLLVPLILSDIAFRLTTGEKKIVGSGTDEAGHDPNIHSTYGLESIVLPYWTDDTDWALVTDPNTAPTIELGFLNGQEDPELFVQDQPNVGSMFAADKITYKIRHEYGGDVQDHRGMFKAVVAG